MSFSRLHVMGCMFCLLCESLVTLVLNTFGRIGIFNVVIRRKGRVLDLKVVVPESLDALHVTP